MIDTQIEPIEVRLEVAHEARGIGAHPPSEIAQLAAGAAAAHQRHLDIHDRRLRMLMLRAERDQSRRNAFRGTGV